MKMLVWRNGRRKGLKIPRRQLHVGSTPTTSTKDKLKDFESLGTSTPVGARPRTSRSRLWLKTTITGLFFTRRPLEGNFMWVRLPPPAPKLKYKKDEYIRLLL